MKTVSPLVIVDNCEDALNFYQKVVGIIESTCSSIVRRKLEMYTKR
jgi:uncharacterized glyoxalase superfamily protein PhnB